ncbi:MAG TPA: tRNA (adenosine(37)-N6)-threonylcarbamoyltransferase complex ATPase subunit type 1 TsaE [Stellaceae bacterium]|nr:tRNA (adenosine(37)-N6)-threonylcarbamoyltransferase complex ATPase subunit type 1 TsaE [Stellaceae bacterium]
MSSSAAPAAIEQGLVDEAATHALARMLAAVARPGDVVALRGDLGLGKTSFARAFIRAFIDAPDEEVPSPTFTLVQTYAGGRGTVWHVDAYRLEDPEEAVELGLEEALSEGVMLIEWPERLGAALPADRLDVALLPGASPTARLARLTSAGATDWTTRLAPLHGGFDTTCPSPPLGDGTALEGENADRDHNEKGGAP